MNFRSLSTVGSLKGKRVIVRVDFNVPLLKRKVHPYGDAKLRAVAPFIRSLRKRGARVILISHLGRPSGHDASLSLRPVASRFRTMIRAVKFIAHPIDSQAIDKSILRMKDGDVALLENLRFYSGEEENTSFFSRRLASFADMYINNAFAVAHRAHASTVGITAYLPSFAGPLIVREIHQLERVLHTPEQPFVVVLGGAKLSTKLPVINALRPLADTLCIGGGMANAFFRAKGLSTGMSILRPSDIRHAKTLLRKRNIILPVDVVVSTKLDGSGTHRVALPQDVAPHEYIVDIGPETVRQWSVRIKAARTMVWNGPVGIAEVPAFSHGSIILGRVIAGRSSGRAFGVVGGGDTLPVLERTGMAEYVDHISTGGGAMLELLAGIPLPALTPLVDSSLS